MSLQDILQSIEKKADEEIDSLERQAVEKKQQLESDWNKKIDDRKEELLAEAKRKADDKVRQAEFVAKSQAQQELLLAKQKVIGQSYQKALGALAQLDEQNYVALLTKLLKQIPENTGKIASVKNKTELLEKALALSGKNFEMVTETISGTGGFIFSSEKLDIDNTFEALVENVKDSTSTEVAKILFGNKD